MTSTDLIAGLAQYLADRGIGFWSEAGYTSDQTGIYDSYMPDVDRGIQLSTYSISDDPSLSDTVMGIQVICRMPGPDPRPARDLADQVFMNFHGATNLDLASGVHLVSLTRRSAVSLGLENQRWDWSANYYGQIWWPSTHRQ